jgi:hypothetical protein
MIKHIFYCPFTGKGPFNGFRGQDWYDFRAGIFEDYTIKSLKYQSNKDFLLWCSFRPEEFDNPTTKKIKRILKNSGLKYIMTYQGTMMTEDRAVEHNIDLKERLSKALPEVRKVVEDADYIYETNLDSDDTLRYDFSEMVQNKKFKKNGALYMKHGFVYNIKDRLAEWHNPSSQQNYTVMFPAEIYFDADKRLEYLNGLKSHEEIPKLFDAEEMPEGMYCAIIHGTNISTVWEHPFMGREYFYSDDKDTILKNFWPIN